MYRAVIWRENRGCLYLLKRTQTMSSFSRFAKIGLLSHVDGAYNNANGNVAVQTSAAIHQFLIL